MSVARFTSGYAKLKGKAVKRLDRSLNALVKKPYDHSRFINWLGLLSPVAASIYAFRTGRITLAKAWLSRAPANRGVRLTARCDEILSNSSIAVANASDNRSLPYGTRVLMAVHSSGTFDQNGYAVRSEQLFSALKRSDIDISVVTRLGYPWDLSQHRTLAASTHSVSKSGQRYEHTQDPGLLIGGCEAEYLERYTSMLCQYLAREKCNWVHAHSNYLNGIAAAAAAKKMEVGSIYEARGLWHLTRSLEQPDYANSELFCFQERREVEAAMSCDRVCVISQPLADWFVERGVAPNKITVMGNASDSAPIELSQKQSSSKFRVGYVGSLVSYEGLLTLIEAFALLAKQHPDVELVIVGDGRQRKELEAKVKQLGISQQAQLTGRIAHDKIGQIYAGLDVVVVPRESNVVTEMIPPLKPYEVFRYQVPLVCSNVLPLRDIVQDGVTGMLFEPGDASGLAELLAALRKDPVLGRSLIAGGSSWVQANTWEHNAMKYKDIYLGRK